MGREDQQGLWLAAILPTTSKTAKSVVIDDKEAYGKGLADEIAKAIQAKQVKVVLRELDHGGRKGLPGLVSKSSSRRGLRSWLSGGAHTKWRADLRQRPIRNSADKGSNVMSSL